MSDVSNKIWQEFYCAVSGGGCGGYVMVKLNGAFNGVVKVICPNCKHEHQRVVEGGHIKENYSSPRHGVKGRYDAKTVEHEIVPTMAAFSKTPRTHAYLTADFTKDYTLERVCPVITDPAKQIGDGILRQSWLDRHGVKNAK